MGDEEPDQISWVIKYQGWEDDLAGLFAKTGLNRPKDRTGKGPRLCGLVGKRIQRWLSKV